MQNISTLIGAAQIAEKTVENIPNWFVVCMGIGTVFASLVAIIIICKITSALCGVRRRTEGSEEHSAAEIPAKNTPEEEKNRQEIIAAVAAVCAEDMGTDISALRIYSFKKI